MPTLIHVHTAIASLSHDPHHPHIRFMCIYIYIHELCSIHRVPRGSLPRTCRARYQSRHVRVSCPFCIYIHTNVWNVRLDIYYIRCRSNSCAILFFYCNARIVHRRVLQSACVTRDRIALHCGDRVIGGARLSAVNFNLELMVPPMMTMIIRGFSMRRVQLRAFDE